MTIKKDCIQSEIANADISGLQAVVLTSSGLETVNSAADALLALGVATGDFDSGQNASFFDWHSAKLEILVSAAVAKGAELSIGSDGKGKTAASGELVVGIVTEAAANADESCTFIPLIKGVKS